MSNPRALVAIGLLAALGIFVVAILVAGGSGGATGGPVRSEGSVRSEQSVGSSGPVGRAAPMRTVRSELTLERFVVPTTGQPEELVVSLPAQRLNALETTGGETQVLLRCIDENGAQRLRQTVAWPLLEETGFPPHLHQPIRPDVLDSIRGCRLTGTGIDFEGRVPGRVPSGG